MQQMSLGKWSVLRYHGSATAKQDVQPDEVEEFKVQQLTVDHWIEGNMAFILRKVIFINSYLLPHIFLPSFHTHAFAVLHLCRPGQMGIPSVCPGLLAVTRGARDAGSQVFWVILDW